MAKTRFDATIMEQDCTVILCIIHCGLLFYSSVENLLLLLTCIWKTLPVNNAAILSISKLPYAAKVAWVAHYTRSKQSLHDTSTNHMLERLHTDECALNPTQIPNKKITINWFGIWMVENLENLNRWLRLPLDSFG